MLFQHDPSEPVGVWLELVEDFRGLRARGRLIPEVARARELLALVRGGAVDGLSIGFRTVKGRVDPASRVRRIHDLDLWEISIVTFPLLAGARVRAKGGSPPSEADPRAGARRAGVECGARSCAAADAGGAHGAPPRALSARKRVSKDELRVVKDLDELNGAAYFQSSGPSHATRQSSLAAP